MSRYLYGASVQGIQDFIFATNRLQEIVGASEIVKSIANIFEDKYNPDEILINTAGNIKAVFSSYDECQKVVLEFSKSISQMAYGITISQAVVEFDGEAKNYINELEKNLKIQRNKPSIPLDMSINIMKLNPKTARAKINQDEDIATSQKLKANREFYKKNSSVTEFKDFSYMKNSKGKIAIIHIDGNGLGKIVKDLGEKLSAFSIALDKATKDAVKEAKEDYMHIREVIVGGDDVTVICNANDALEFTKNFLTNFEDETKKIKELKGIKDKLTACAGIAYCNEKYPFHYAVDLAEALCGVAKKFHNIQSSHYQSWNKFVEDELTISDNVKCDFGAYYLNQSPKIDDFIVVLENLRLKESPASRLREWLSELYRSDINAQYLLDRIDKIYENKKEFKKSIFNDNLSKLHKDLTLNNLIVDRQTPIYDILQILSITEAK